MENQSFYFYNFWVNVTVKGNARPDCSEGRKHLVVISVLDFFFPLEIEF